MDLGITGRTAVVCASADHGKRSARQSQNLRRDLRLEAEDLQQVASLGRVVAEVEVNVRELVAAAAVSDRRPHPRTGPW
jgi:hypothetical protein